jgi:hypothetical protein
MHTLSKRFQQATGVLFMLGAVLVNVPYALLIATFNYPDILREPPSVILTQFAVGGTPLILTWLAFAWVGFPLLLAIVMLQHVMGGDRIPYLWAGTVAGVVGAVVQMIGLLRWVFVVPVLAGAYVDPAAGAAARESAVVAFQVVHQFGGVLLGEHLGQAFTIVWMVVVSLAALRSSLFKPFVGWLGMAAAAIYAMAQFELLATVVPTLPTIPLAGLIGSLLWLLWMIVLGASLLRRRTTEARSPAGFASAVGSRGPWRGTHAQSASKT